MIKNQVPAISGHGEGDRGCQRHLADFPRNYFCFCFTVGDRTPCTCPGVSWLRLKKYEKTRMCDTPKFQIVSGCRVITYLEDGR